MRGGLPQVDSLGIRDYRRLIPWEEPLGRVMRYHRLTPSEGSHCIMLWLLHMSRLGEPCVKHPAAVHIVCVAVYDVCIVRHGLCIRVYTFRAYKLSYPLYRRACTFDLGLLY